MTFTLIMICKRYNIMRKIYTIVLLSLLSFSILLAKDITQISANNPHYLLSITRGGVPIGSIEVELFPEVAPKHCHNFDSLVSIQFYDGTAFHRVIPKFMIQGGDPNSKDKPKSTWGYGDPSQQTVPAEFSSLKHVRGILSAARAQDINSATSQFFICVVAYPSLDGKYSIYGQVVKGMEVADTIVNSPRDASNNPLEKVEMKITKLGADMVNEVSSATNKNIFAYFSPDNNEILFKSDLDNYFVSGLKVYDLSGELLISNSYNSNTTLEQVRVRATNFTTGAYLIQLTNSENTTTTIKVLIQ